MVKISLNLASLQICTKNAVSIEEHRCASLPLTLENSHIKTSIPSKY